MMFKRWLIAVVSGAIITAASFYGMALMIGKSHSKLGSADDNSTMNFIRVKRDASLDVKKRKKPEPPKKPKTPPKMPKMNVANNTPTQTPQMKMDLPKFDIPLSLGNGPALGAAMPGNDGNSELVPIVRIEPRYPRKAAMAGVEGWVKLKFEISESGTVENVQVLESKPRRIFDRSAVQGLLKWKYKPRMVEGKPVREQATVQLDFKLEGA